MAGLLCPYAAPRGARTLPAPEGLGRAPPVTTPPEPFTFGIPLIPRASARNWALVEALLGLTWASLARQTDPRFRVLVVGHERPRVLPRDPRITFVAVDWPIEPPGPGNGDGGRKKELLSDLVLDAGGGLFMPLDADDWVDVRLVETARRHVGPDAVGGVIASGHAVDFQSLQCAALPLAANPDLEFLQLCGSSTIARLRADEADPLRRNAFRTLRSHHEWHRTAAEQGAHVVRLPLGGAYVVNTSENHSELHGPHVAWRGGFVDAVNLGGAMIDPAFVSRFGLEIGQITRVSQRFFAHRARTA